ncbi:ATP-dependent nuclease [Arthrobacter sp. 2MCAF14]|uniref:ATP-dependent nuclease n=1 Tax=Arthrobacter sp. 2MCAF14 TaxID=3232982 RepID=UPI003F8F4FB6
MKVRKVSIKNYRGIKEAEWVLDGSFVAFVGPGDSTKTTLLDALGLVLSTRYNIAFTDADFYDCDPSRPIVIEAVMVDLPDELVNERSHGKNRSGVTAAGVVVNDPVEDEDTIECLIVRLSVDQSLEPVWEVVRPGEVEGARISVTERGHLGFFRIGDFVDSHLRWGRSSALSALTQSKSGAASAVMEAQRQARQAIGGLTGTPLHDAAILAQTEVKKLGSGPFVDLKPGLDPSIGVGTASLVLHDGNIPLTQFGLGSRRLLSLSIQENALAGRSIVAIDEIENGLDPHRLAHLIRYLKDRARNEDLQVIFTTHSALVVESLAHDQIYVVRSSAGKTSVSAVPSTLAQPQADVLQGVIRERPSAFLASKVLVGEGATEVGVLRHLLWYWDQSRTSVEDVTSVTAGVGVMNGSGDSQAPGRSSALAQLGYPTLLVIDGDVISNTEAIAAAADNGVVVVQWPLTQALEDVIVEALPVEGLQDVVDYAVADRSEEAICAAIASRLGVSRITSSLVADWISEHGEAKVRSAIAAAAKGAKPGKDKEESKAWFKREDRGESLGAIIVKHLAAIQSETLLDGLASISAFVYGVSLVAAPAGVGKSEAVA